MPTITKEERKRLDILVDKIIADDANRQDILEAAEIGKKYTRNLKEYAL